MTNEEGELLNNIANEYWEESFANWPCVIWLSELLDQMTNDQRFSSLCPPCLGGYSHREFDIAIGTHDQR